MCLARIWHRWRRGHDLRVVGVDGSPAAAAALAWAAEEARLRSTELVASMVPDRPGSSRAVDLAAVQAPHLSVEEPGGGSPVMVHHCYGEAAAELIAACTAADLLVVGSRGRRPLGGFVLGSVSRACLAHAPCPVVVVRPQPKRASSRGRVVVGVDGSSHSRQALCVAADEARLRGAELAVVHAVYWDNSGEELLTPTRKQLVVWGRKLVAAELAATGVTGRPVVVHGQASEVLVRRSAHADLLLVARANETPSSVCCSAPRVSIAPGTRTAGSWSHHAPEERNRGGQPQAVESGEVT